MHYKRAQVQYTRDLPRAMHTQPPRTRRPRAGGAGAQVQPRPGRGRVLREVLGLARLVPAEGAKQASVHCSMWKE